MAGKSDSVAEKVATSPEKKDAPQPSASSVNIPRKPLSAGIGHAQTEVPKLPASNYDIPRRSRDDPLVIGNKSYELALRMDGRLGFTKARENSMFPAVNCDLSVSDYQRAIMNVLSHVLGDLYRLKKPLSDAEIRPRVEDVATMIARGICVMTYLKLRAVNLTRPDYSARFSSKPRVSEPFEVPEPFALAISQLGVVEVSSLTKRVTCYPTVSQTDAATYLLPRKSDWSQTAYAEAVRIAKDLGMSFSKVDLNVKVGSSWWLFKPHFDEDVFSLRCQIPEDNYTLAGAVIRSLFHVDANSGPAPELFNLANIADVNYGSFIRGPREGIAYAAYYAITSEGTEDFWKSAI